MSREDEAATVTAPTDVPETVAATVGASTNWSAEDRVEECKKIEQMEKRRPSILEAFMAQGIPEIPSELSWTNLNEIVGIPQIGFLEDAQLFEPRLLRKIEKLQKKLKSPIVATYGDKLSFLSGVALVLCSAFMIGRYPMHLQRWYTLFAFLLLSVRAVVYRLRRWHYFIFDFCYFANVLLLLFLHLWPDDARLFRICFSFASGPLIWGIVTWKNSMAFHSIDKMTSLFIHLSPPMVTFSMRWHHDSAKYLICDLPDCKVTFSDMVLVPLLPYFFWQFLYFIKVEVFSIRNVREKEYITSLTYFIKHNRSALGTTLRRFRPGLRPFIFMGLQLVYTAVTMLSAKFFWDYEWLHGIFLTGMVVMSIWNGAFFYVGLNQRKKP